jgi:hypothetical protein
MGVHPLKAIMDDQIADIVDFHPKRHIFEAGMQNSL